MTAACSVLDSFFFYISFLFLMINPAAANIATPTNEKRFDGVSPVTGSESCVVLVVERVV